MANRIHRTKHKKVNGHFTIIPNYSARNESLSMAARGLLLFLLSQDPDQFINKQFIYSAFPDGRYKIDNAYKELLVQGYICEDKQKREGGRFAGKDYVVYETPLNESLPNLMQELLITSNGKTAHKTDKLAQKDGQISSKEEYNILIYIPMENLLLNDQPYFDLLCKKYSHLWTKEEIEKFLSACSLKHIAEETQFTEGDITRARALFEKHLINRSLYRGNKRGRQNTKDVNQLLTEAKKLEDASDI